jgi:L-threonylcarbamoyladenylate synthase
MMTTAPRVLSVQGQAPDPAVLAEAARIVRHGGLVAFPTETVYGLAADATNPDALARLNRVKGRAPEKPYSIHLHDPAQITAYVDVVPEAARRLMQRFWPGPLTLVLLARDGRTVGFRLPDHPVARAFLAACAVPVVAPSANHAGAPPPTDATEVLASLDGEIDGILDAGPTTLGRESSVVEIIGSDVLVRREGALSEAAILAAASAR